MTVVEINNDVANALIEKVRVGETRVVGPDEVAAAMTASLEAAGISAEARPLYFESANIMRVVNHVAAAMRGRRFAG